MRVRANSEMVARKVVPTVLRAPSAVEIRLANEGTAFLFEGAIVTDVDFSVEEGSIELIETGRRSELTPAATGYERATRSRRRREARQMQTGRSPQQFHGALIPARAAHASLSGGVGHTSRVVPKRSARRKRRPLSGETIGIPRSEESAGS
jgi:hypothetical protein